MEQLKKLEKMGYKIKLKKIVEDQEDEEQDLNKINEEMKIKRQLTKKLKEDKIKQYIAENGIKICTKSKVDVDSLKESIKTQKEISKEIAKKMNKEKMVLYYQEHKQKMKERQHYYYYNVIKQAPPKPKIEKIPKPKKVKSEISYYLINKEHRQKCLKFRSEVSRLYQLIETI